MMIKAVIFDLDGVLIDSEKLKAEAWEKILEGYGIRNAGEWYKNNIGTTRINLCKKIIEKFSLPVTPEEFAEKKIKTYSGIIQDRTEPIADAVDFLKLIRDKFKIGLAAATNLKILEKQLKKIGIYDYFDVITSGEDEVKNNKPNPEIYIITAKKLGVRPDECVAIEDSYTGVESAKNAGMRCVAVPNDYTKKQDFSKADIIVRSLSEFSVEQIHNLDRK